MTRLSLPSDPRARTRGLHNYLILNFLCVLCVFARDLPFGFDSRHCPQTGKTFLWTPPAAVV